MLNKFNNKLTALRNRLNDHTVSTDVSTSNDVLLGKNLSENLINIRKKFSNSSDFINKDFVVSGVNVSIIMCEGMVNLQSLSELVIEPLTNAVLGSNSTGEDLLEFIRKDSMLAADQKEIFNLGEVFQFIMSGFIVILIDGIDRGIALGLQGFMVRSIGEPETEVNVRGSKEGFIEALRINLTMVRRRIKSETLKFELLTVGDRSKTDVCMIYLTDVASPSIVNNIRNRLKSIKLDIVMESAYIQPFLEEHPLSMFATVGATERPDTLCSKINEGRIAILVDGTPFALIAPYFFVENFQNMDDYTHKPIYSTFIRWLKYFSFFMSFLLPGLYVAITTFNPELFPPSLLFNIAAATETTPFTLAEEAFIIHLIFEIMREAGLRLPRPIGHAVSIVGALVIGDAAVTAGIIGAPMVMVVAVTAISSFVVPTLYEPVMVLKFTFIVVAGGFGLYGIALGLALLGIKLCAKTTYDIPYTAPVSPFNMFDMRDVFIRTGWTKLGKKKRKVQNYPGSEVE